MANFTDLFNTFRGGGAGGGGGLDISAIMQQLMSVLGLPQNIAENIYKKSAGVIGRTAGETRGRLHQAALSSGLTDTPTTIPGIANIGKREAALKGEAMGSAQAQEAQIKAGLIPAFLSFFARFAQMAQRERETTAATREPRKGLVGLPPRTGSGGYGGYPRREGGYRGSGIMWGPPGSRGQPFSRPIGTGGGGGVSPARGRTTTTYYPPGQQTAMGRASAAESRRAKEARQRYRQSKETHKEAMRTSRRARKIRREKARKTFWD